MIIRPMTRENQSNTDVGSRYHQGCLLRLHCLMSYIFCIPYHSSALLTILVCSYANSYANYVRCLKSKFRLLCQTTMHVNLTNLIGVFCYCSSDTHLQFIVMSIMRIFVKLRYHVRFSLNGLKFLVSTLFFLCSLIMSFAFI